MTAYLDGEAKTQVDAILINTKIYSEKDIKWLIEKYGDEISKPVKKKQK